MSILVAQCQNVREPEGTHCPGQISYRWGQSDAACDTCGARCGIAVADWLTVRPAAPAAEACEVCGDPDCYGPSGRHRLAAPAAAEAEAARLREQLARVEALRAEWATGVLLSRRFAANELKRALDGTDG